ncbi:MAG: hypothetical protein M1833_003516 [Piccolia ochrophora]|nr:MAG: hypothetical protein M1833_003516 [Piccolia ochrophora]
MSSHYAVRAGPGTLETPTYDTNMSPALKRRRLSRDGHPTMAVPEDGPYSAPPIKRRLPIEGTLGTEHDCDMDDGDKGISFARSASSKMADMTVAPFLAKHIPEQYAPRGVHPSDEVDSTDAANTKFCHRHNPSFKCRRQADGPSSEELQKKLETLPHADKQGIAHVWSLFSAAPSKHRYLMLNGILSQCCYPQLSFVANTVSELIRFDPFQVFPPELTFKTLCYLDTTSLCKAAQVCRLWRSLADDDVVWHRMCEQHIDRKCTKCGWGLPLLERKRLRATKRQIQLRATGKGLNVWSPNITPLPEAADCVDNVEPPSQNHAAVTSAAGTTSDELLRLPEALAIGLASASKREKTPDSYFQPHVRPWKEVYKDRFKVGTNWKYGRCSVKSFKGHTNGVMCLQFDDTILATGSYDATIKIWDVKTGKELRTLRGHESGVRALQFDDNKLISGSMDRTLKVWNWHTGECLSTYSGHSGGVIGLHFEANVLASGSVDKTVKIWNFENKSTFLLRGHKDWVNCVRVDSASRTVFSASDDCTVRLWDLDSKSCIQTYEGHVGQVQQVLPLPREFEFDENEDDDSSGRNSQPSSGAVSPAPDVDNSAFEHLFSDSRIPPPQYMLTSALDSTIRLWDVPSGRCLRTFFGHVEGVWALAADTLRIVSGAEDRMVKVWDPRSGKCERTFTGHAGPVTCVGLSDSRICTGGEDCEVKLYSFQNDVIDQNGHGDGAGSASS